MLNTHCFQHTDKVCDSEVQCFWRFPSSQSDSMNIDYYYKLILCNNLMYQITVENEENF